MPFEYNTQRGPLLLKEYGRNVQNLTRYIAAAKEKDKEERTALAHTLIGLMKQINPAVRENTDNNQRIWDHLHFMADFKLDIDNPYPVPERGELFRRPKHIGYNRNEVGYKHYGRNLELLIQKVIDLEDPEERQAVTVYLFKLMKNFYSAWNKENPEDEVIIDQLNQLSKGKLKLDMATLHEALQERTVQPQAPHAHEQQRFMPEQQRQPYQQHQYYRQNQGKKNKQKDNKRRK